MKKILFLLMMFMAVNASAQTNIRHKVDSLQQQVEKLTYDFHYLDCSTQLDILNLKLSNYINDIKNAVDRILINVNREFKFSQKNCELMKMEYDSAVELFQYFKHQIGLMKWDVSTKTESIGFRESDIETFKSRFKVLEAAINTAEVNLKYYKDVVDVVTDR